MKLKSLGLLVSKVSPNMLDKIILELDVCKIVSHLVKRMQILL